MLEAYVKSPSIVDVRDTPRPKPEPGGIIVGMRSCGVCGSDLEKIYGKYSQPSTRLGHEPSGIVTETGYKTTDFSVGDRVFVHHHVPCYSCHYCLHGNETMCQRYSETNLSPCGLAEEFTVPEWNVSHGGVIRLPDHVSFDEAAMIEPLACCIRAWGKTKVREGDSVAVLGAGPTGMMHIMLAKNYGMKDIFCMDINGYRLRFAEKFGVSGSFRSDDPESNQRILSATGGRGVDVAMVATGSTAAILQSVNLVRKGGTVMLFGVPPKDAMMSLDISKIYSKEITITPSYAASEVDTNEAFRLIEGRRVDVMGLITHRFDLSNSAEAFECAHKGKDAMKIIVTNSETLN